MNFGCFPCFMDLKHEYSADIFNTRAACNQTCFEDSYYSRQAPSSAKKSLKPIGKNLNIRNNSIECLISSPKVLKRPEKKANNFELNNHRKSMPLIHNQKQSIKKPRLNQKSTATIAIQSTRIKSIGLSPQWPKMRQIIDCNKNQYSIFSPRTSPITLDQVSRKTKQPENKQSNKDQTNILIPKNSAANIKKKIKKLQKFSDLFEELHEKQKQSISFIIDQDQSLLDQNFTPQIKKDGKISKLV